jgi:hypothetical protein
MNFGNNSTSYWYYQDAGGTTSGLQLAHPCRGENRESPHGGPLRCGLWTTGARGL